MAEIRQYIAVPSPDNAVARRLGHVVLDLADGDQLGAREHLAPLIGVTRATHPREKMPTLPRESWPKGVGAKTRNPPAVVMARVFRRDRFTCLYCGRWTIPTQVLRLISAAFVEEFPYHNAWKAHIAPRAYWDISTSLDHVHAVSTGGDWQDPQNLATACYRCQEQKSNLPLEVLGWPMRVTESGWDGLTSLYPALWQRLGQPDGAEHRKWLRAFRAAEDPAARPASS